MSDLKVTGKIVSISETQQITASFSKRNLVLETSEQYPQLLEFEFPNERGNILNGYNVGDIVDVSFNLRGREYKGEKGTRYIMSLSAWKMFRTDGSKTVATEQAPANQKTETTKTESNQNTEDLPF